MSYDAQITTPADGNANAGIQHDWSTHAPPEMTPESIEALRSSFKQGCMGMVEYYDVNTIIQNPWDFILPIEDLRPSVGLSIGFLYNLADDNAVYVRPHLGPFEDDEIEMEGEIVIPYSSIRFIIPLTAGKEAFSCYRSSRSAAGDTESDTENGTR
jgi:hypothetical protein